MTIANHSEFLLKLDLQKFSEELPTEPSPVEPIEPTGGGEPIDPIPSEPLDLTPPQDEFDIIKYNKEEIKLPVSERQTYLQKGYNYDKVQQKVSDYEQHLNRVAQFAGYQTHDEMLTALDEMEKQQKAQQEAQRLGMDEEAYKQYVAPVNEKLSTVEKQLEEMKIQSIQREIQAELATLEKNPEFQKYETPMYELAQKYGMSLTDAFEFASLRGLKEQIPAIQQQTEQKVVNQIRARQGKHVESNDENGVVSLNLSPDELAYAQRMGISPEDYAKYK